jgi:aspartyl-tRNA(Asn)/glutamyl-tRNA(Gln) amidotransferase subunit B
VATKEIIDKYVPVIGLEIHMQLRTASKAYSSDANRYGDQPNTLVSPITLALPGTLPRHNKKVVDFALLLGLAVEADVKIGEYVYARKNYFYADLPKGYQITQDKTPICTGGRIWVKDKEGRERVINITRIHMEEDAGKSIHDLDPFDSLIDLNRAGVPLLEMVSEPEIRSGEEAKLYLSEVRKLVRYLEICDGNMEEGSMRCDANISVMLRNAEKYGRRVEVKNMNSISNVQRAIDYEINRQIELIEAGEIVDQDTRSFDAISGQTFSMRSKEMANDYRYFPEPDLAPLYITQEWINNAKEVLNIKPLPRQLLQLYLSYGLTDYEANWIIEDKHIESYFKKLTETTKNYKSAVNWMMGPIKSYLNENAIEIADFILEPKKIAELIKLVDDGKVSNTVAVQTVLPELLKNSSKTALQVAEEQNKIQQSDEGSLKEFAEKAIAMYPDKVKEYRSGKTGLIGLFMGEVMKLSKGKADPKVANKIVKELLDAQ